ncbi:MAG: phasin family protein [Hyphomicrobiales bacterium]|nr:phasin family protein [Hyphomicrobiales bacterium]
MMNKSADFEIPATFREAAQKSVEQAKETYHRISDATRQAQDMVLKSSEAMSAGVKEMQDKALQYAEANINAGFEVASRLVNAKDFTEALEIQGQYARKQMETLTAQTQEMSRLVAQAAQKAQPTV